MLKCNIFLEIITCDPSIYTMDHRDLIALTLWKIPLVWKGLFRVLPMNVGRALQY